MAATEKNKQTKVKWTGLGLWNVFFIGEFLLGGFGYLSLNLLQNVLLLVFVLFPIGNRYLRWFRTSVAVVCAAALVYSESWLPGLDSIRGNFHNLAAMESGYLLDSALNFFNFEMIGAGIALIIIYYAIRDYIRVTTFTVGYLFILLCAPLWQPFVAQLRAPAPATEVVASVDNAKKLAEEEKKSDLIPQTAEPTSKNLDEWLKRFHDTEKDRRAEWPDKLAKDSTPFDILLLNICSLSNDDLKAVGLENHEVLKQFNIRFENFNSATSYSGPAALRLLKSVCGQPSHEDLYEGRNPDCEIMNRLARLGYNQHVFMDHSGKYDNFYQSLRHLAGLSPQLAEMKYPKRYDSFDEEPIGDARAVFKDYENTIAADKGGRSATFINMIALHDGNRFANKRRLAPFKPRAQAMLDDLGSLITDLEKSGRKVMLVVVPEHGAAEKGDKVQVAHLRDIPSPAITHVPALVKFIGVTPADSPVTVDTKTSYLAVSSLIGRVLETNYFGKPEGEVPLKDLVKDLPQTHSVSENANAKVVNYKGKDYVKMDNKDWREYAK